MQLQGKDCAPYLQELVKKFEAEPQKKLANYLRVIGKIGIIQALMHQPDVLIMDEPTSGLDPLMQEVFTQKLGQLLVAAPQCSSVAIT